MVDLWGRVLQANPNVTEKSDHGKNGGLPVKFTNNVSLDCNAKASDVGSGRTTKSANIFRTVLNSSNDFFCKLHTRLNAALSLDDKEDDDNDSDSVLDGYMKKKQRDSGGDFGESSTSASLDIGCGGATSGSSVCSRNYSKNSRYPKRWMDPTLGTNHYKGRPSNQNRAFKSAIQNEVDSTSEDLRTSHRKHRRSRKTSKISSSSMLDSDPISSNESGSESEIRNAETVNREIDSSSIGNSTSEASLLSWSSSLSHESQTDESNTETVEFMRQFVHKLLNNNAKISLEEKAHFGKLCQTEAGRLWFARFINAQRMNKKVAESTFYYLVQYFAIVIFECFEADDYGPAKSLMNMCFTFYHEVAVPGCEPYKEFLYLYLKDQPIWQSLRFWNAAFFDAVQCERAHRPIATRKDLEHYSPRDIKDEKEFQENITFGQLGSFTCNMHAFGLSKELCLEFLRKQSTIADLKPDQITTIKENIELMYSETEPWRS